MGSSAMSANIWKHLICIFHQLIELIEHSRVTNTRQSQKEEKLS